MIHFNQLGYSKDNKYLIIDVGIDYEDYYSDVILDSIVIDNQDTFIVNGPSSTPLYTYKIEEEHLKVYSIPENCSCDPVRVKDDESYCFTYDQDAMKHVRLELLLSSIGVDPCKDILFVYAIATGAPAVDTPCGFDNSKIMGTVFNLQGIYNGMMSYIRQLENNCVIPKNFIDAILKYKALEVAIRTGNYPLAVQYWKKFYQDKTCSSTTNIKPCGCYG